MQRVATPTECRQETMASYFTLLVVLGAISVAQSEVQLEACPINYSPLFTYEAGLPNGCLNDTDDCEYYLKMGPNSENSNYVDIHLEGTLGNEIGWIAVGFSLDRLMFNDDVLACLRDKNNSVYVIDGWNPPKRHTANQRDPTQEGMCTYETEYTDNRISCSFSRYYDIVNPGYDWDLRNGSYYLFWGRSTYTGDGTADQSLPYHNPHHPVISDSMMSPYSDNNTNGTGSSQVNKRVYEQAHGVLMTITYVLLAGTGIFFSSWMKSVFPNGLWLKIHRALMIASLISGVGGFAIIFIGMRDNPIPGLLGFECTKEKVHFAFGIIVMAMHLFNPLLGLIRPKPESKERIWFNVIHGFGLGYFTKILAFVNIGIGLILFQSPGCSTVNIGGLSGDYIFIYHLIYVVFVIFWEILLYGVFTYFTLKAPFNMRAIMAPSLLRPFFQQDNRAGYKPLPDIQQDSDYKLCDKSLDYFLRWISFAVFFGVTVLITILNVSFLIADKKSLQTGE